jgi:hypothetical protein
LRAVGNSGLRKIGALSKSSKYHETIRTPMKQTLRVPPPMSTTRQRIDGRRAAAALTPRLDTRLVNSGLRKAIWLRGLLPQSRRTNRSAIRPAGWACGARPALRGVPARHEFPNRLAMSRHRAPDNFGSPPHRWVVIRPRSARQCVFTALFVASRLVK